MSSKETAESSPLVSIVIPMHNSSATIACLIESLMGQQFADFEAIMVDDGSHDGSASLACALTQHDKRFSVYEREASGVSRTRNYGLSLCRGQWVAFADADDWLAPYALEKLAAGAQQGADFCIADFYRVKDGRYSVKGVGINGLLSFGEFMRQMSLAPANYYYGSLWNKLFRRSLIEGQGLRFKNTLDFGEDHVFVLEYLQSVERIAVIGKPIYYYIDTPGSLVHRAMNPIGVAKNKNEVMAVYEKLCTKAGINNTLAGEATVMSFLITPATDGMVSPFDEKLGIAQVPPRAAEIDARFKGLFHRSSSR
ncbi:MAG: glycosyltransferase family 2 protein [Coriobacteriales bacterium]